MWNIVKGSGKTNTERSCIIKAKSVAVRVVLINRKALLVLFCVHFKMLVVH